jgi:hypothetical protein
MRRVGLVLALAALGAMALAGGIARGAEFGLNNFKVAYTNASGEPVTQAGAHPFAMTTSFNLNTEIIGGGEFPVQAIKDLSIAQIEGFAGDQTAVPPCSTLDFLTKLGPSLPNCANSAAVGIAHVTIGIGSLGKGTRQAPIYNLEPAPGTVAKLGFWIQGVPISIDVGLAETYPYNITATTTNTSQVLEVYAAEITLWGVPADHAHDEERGSCFEGSSSCEAGVAEAPFLTVPRACLGTLDTSYEVNSWQDPERLVRESVPTASFSGCGELAFDPELSARPGTTFGTSASGLDVALSMSDEGLKNAKGNATKSDIRSVRVALPAGVTVNPSAAEGLGVCTLAQYGEEGLHTPARAGCPDSSKLGTVTAETPLLGNHPLHGALYLAKQEENPFGSLLALYLVIRDQELGIFIKQAGRVQPNEEPGPNAGRLVTSFEELPQFPLSHVSLQLREGPRAPLITPSGCGAYASTATLTPWSGGPAQVTNPSFQIESGPGGGPCPPAGPRPFAPGFHAGSTNNAGGHYAPFFMRITRADGEQDITRFSATLPPGVTGKLAGIGRCSDAAIEAAKKKSGRAELASPSCPASSQIGHVLAGAGVGSALTYVGGSVYLAGPFAGDPLSVVAIVPAVAGPFDVGTVVTREALDLNPSTAEVEVDGAHSDPIPHILRGIPLAVRELRVFVDRPDFTLNPTNCSEERARAQITGSGADAFNSADDVPFGTQARYQAADCQALGFKPKLTLSLKGATKRAGHPSLRSVLTPRPGDANIGRAVVTLPNTEFIDNAHINNPCTRVQFNANQCPASSVLGTARAVTPLLDQPLEGPVYFRSNGGERKLPDVVADLRGQFNIVLVGFVDTATPKTNPRVRTTFSIVPDAPVSKFTLNLYGGKKGLLVNNSNLCAKTRHATLDLTGQNGLPQHTQPKVATSCKGSGGSKKRPNRG